MKNSVYALLMVLLLNSSYVLGEDTLSLLEAKALKGMTVKIEGLGGHSEYCVKISLTNSTPNTLNILISPGILMKPEDENLQDLLVVEKKFFSLLPKRAIVSKLRAFCAAASKSSPGKKSIFNATSGDSNLIKLAAFIDKNPKIGDIQSAVWVVANGTPITSIDNKNTELLKVVSSLSKQTIADYTVIFANTSGALFSNKAARIKGEIEYSVTGEDLVSFQIYDANGRLRKTIYKGRLSQRGKHVEEYDIDVSKLKKGVYYIKVYQQNQLIRTKRFEI